MPFDQIEAIYLCKALIIRSCRENVFGTHVVMRFKFVEHLLGFAKFLGSEYAVCQFIPKPGQNLLAHISNKTEYQTATQPQCYCAGHSIGKSCEMQ